MKKTLYLLLVSIWIGILGSITPTVSASNSYRDITLTTAGTLIDSLATGNIKIDSIIVRGPINDFDFSALRNIAIYNQGLVINLAYADVENKTIPEEAFSEDIISEQIRRIILPDDIHTIEKNAFSRLYSLTDINMPTHLRKLGNQAFYYCSGLAPDTLKVPEGVETIPSSCFRNCASLKHILLPKSLKRIEHMAFNQTYEIQSITFQEGLEYIGHTAFSGMGEIDTIRLPQSVTKIGEEAFAENWSLKYINIPAGITTIPAQFAFNTALDSIYIPDNVITIEEGAFCATRCTYLRLSQNLTTVEREAFRAHNLTDILLPASLQFLGNEAFSSGTVKKVYCPANIPPALESTDKGQWAFAGCGENTTLFVPIGCRDTYRNTPGWNNFTNIEEIEHFPSSIEQIGDAATWSATAGKGMIHLKNNSATPAKLHVYSLGGERINSIELRGRKSFAVTAGNYLICDGLRTKTVIVK